MTVITLIAPTSMVNRDFFRQIFQGDKMLLPLSDVKPIVVPKYDELGVVNLMEHMKKDEEFMKFMPDSLAKGRTYDRNYFFTIMFHVHPDHTLKLIRHATEQRMKG